MDTTSRLGLPYIAAAQAQKHVMHNEALQKLDILVQISAINRTLSAPPGSPAEGDRYLVAAGASGLWNGKTNQLALYLNGAWMFSIPQEGWLAWVEAEDRLLVWQGTSWAEITGLNGSLPTLGINAAADMTNRLALASDAVLFSHNGSHHRLKINKATAADTASLLFQDNFSGRAEMGLAGSDDFSFKVSPDGTAWNTAIAIDKTTGVVSFPHTTLGGRETLTANRTYYVRTDGSDSNNGLANTSGSAFLTIQKAVDAVAALDLSIYNTVIQIGDGTYTSSVILKALTGAGTATLRGNISTPASVLVSTTGVHAVSGSGVKNWVLDSFKIQTTTLGSGVYCNGQSYVKFTGLNFGAVPNGGYHIFADQNSIIEAGGNYTISGGASAHFLSLWGGHAVAAGRTITITGAPSFGSYFALCTRAGKIEANGNSFSYPVITITIASPGVVTYTAHGLMANAPIAFATTGALPTGLTAGTTYYVKTVLDANTFTVSTTSGGAVINTSGSQSGTHTISVTGGRYSADLNSVIFTNGGGANYFPGNAAGSAATGGQYI